MYPEAGHVPANIYAPIVGQWPRADRKQETVFVDIDASTFYEYTVTNKDCKLQIRIVDQNSKCWEFEFKRFN